MCKNSKDDGQRHFAPTPLLPPLRPSILYLAIYLSIIGIHPLPLCCHLLQSPWLSGNDAGTLSAA